MWLDASVDDGDVPVLVGSVEEGPLVGLGVVGSMARLTVGAELMSRWFRCCWLYEVDVGGRGIGV